MANSTIVLLEKFCQLAFGWTWKNFANFEKEGSAKILPARPKLGEALVPSDLAYYRFRSVPFIAPVSDDSNPGMAVSGFQV